MIFLVVFYSNDILIYGVLIDIFYVSIKQINFYLPKKSGGAEYPCPGGVRGTFVIGGEANCSPRQPQNVRENKCTQKFLNQC